MKMKFTLLAAAVALFGFNARAQLCQYFETTSDMTQLLTPSNSTKVEAKKLPGVAITGSTDHKNVLIAGAEFKDNVYGKYGPDEKTVGIYADGTAESVRFRFNVGNKDRNTGSAMVPNLSNKQPKDGWDYVYVKMIVGPKPADATSDVLDIRFNLTSKGSTYTVSTPVTTVNLTDEMQVVGVECPAKFTGDWYAPDVETLVLTYVDIYVDGVTTGQFLALESFGAFGRPIPKVGFDTQKTRELGFWGKQEVQPGTIFIQAEDFDGYKEGEEPTFSGYCLGIGDQWQDGYGYTQIPSSNSRWFKYINDLSHVRIDAAQNKTGYGIFQTNPGDYSSQNSGLGFALCGMSRVDGGWGTTYGGEYLDETSNLISFEQALEGFGSWFEYTFEMEEDGYVDISLGACTHSGTAFADIMRGGTKALGGEYNTAYNKPREEGGYVVDGLDDDYLKLYGFCYILSFDGKEQRTNWESRGMPNPRTGALSSSVYANPFEWTNNQEEDGNGNMVNSKFLAITPPYPLTLDGNPGNMWFPVYKSDILGRMMVDKTDDGSGNQVDYDFKKKCDELSAELGYDYYEKHFKDRPDYIDIPCSAGKHTIRVQSTGGCTVFDEIRIHAHKDRITPSGVEEIVAKRVMEEFNGEPEYFDLQGRKVANPGAGLYIVKRGNNVTKEVLR